MLTGRMLDRRYHVRSRIAHGGMATVYLATDTRLDREVALKVMHADLARDAEFVGRFIGEAKSVAQLSHQNIVAVFDQGADGEYLFLAMEYVPGQTLRALMRERGWFTWQEALGIMDPILAGLAAAHQAGIVHRDVKPENVLITPDGRVKVVDFGLARASAAVGNTRAGEIIGSVAYIAPEQVTGAVTDARTDVYSAGVHAVRDAHRTAAVQRGDPPGGGLRARQLRRSARSARSSAGSSRRSTSWSARPPAGTRSGGPPTRTCSGGRCGRCAALSGPDESVSGAWTASNAAAAAGTAAGAAAAGMIGYGGDAFEGGFAGGHGGRGGGYPYGAAGAAGRARWRRRAGRRRPCSTAGGWAARATAPGPGPTPGTAAGLGTAAASTRRRGDTTPAPISAGPPSAAGQTSPAGGSRSCSGGCSAGGSRTWRSPWWP